MVIKRFLIRALDIKKDIEILNSIVKYEDEVFGDGSVGLWNIKPIAKYGKIYSLLYEQGGVEEIVSVVEIIRSFEPERAYIYGVFTVNKYGKQGHAKILLEHVLEFMKEMGITIVELTVQISNENAVRLYKKLGFEIIELLEDEYGDGNPRYLMRCIINK